MAKIPLKEIVFPGLDNTYTIPEIDDTLSTAGKVADAKKTGDEIDGLKEDLNELNSNLADMKSDGVVPSAEQILTDKGVTDSVPYHYRKTVGDGADRLYDQIVGGTVCFNQLVKSGNFENINEWAMTNGSLAVSNNVATITPTYQSGQFAQLYGSPQGVATKPEHKIFVTVDLKSNAWAQTGNAIIVTVAGLWIANLTANTLSSTGWNRISAIKTLPTNVGYVYPEVRKYYESSMADFQIKNFNVFDLTAMFGTTIADYIYQLEQTTAGAGVAFFKSLFPNDYYPYNAGELVSVSGLSEHKMTGFNQWDKKWEVGGYANATGTPWATDDRMRSKSTDYIKVVPNTTYYCGVPKATNFYFYDADKNYISYAEVSAGATFTPPTNARYMRFTVHPNYGTTYKNDICINISDPAKNGTYEPYKGHSYPLDSTLTLRGMFKLDANNNLYVDGDTYDADGKVTRKYGVVDLGTLNWEYLSDTELVTGFYAYLTEIKIAQPTIVGMICSKYKVSSAPQWANIKDKEIGQNMTTTGVTKQIIIKDSAYTDAATFKAAMSGVMLVYELATPTTEEADPYQHLQQCDPNGTEEYVSTGIVPIGHNSFYPENLRAKVEQLPWNFASLIAPTESAFVATRNYVTGDLFIVNNVLYKATSNIANGGTITPNTNCTATTLAEIISALA